MRFHAVKISNFALDGAPDMGLSDLDRQHLIHLDLSCFETVSQDYVFLKYRLLHLQKKSGLAIFIQWNIQKFSDMNHII